MRYTNSIDTSISDQKRVLNAFLGENQSSELSAASVTDYLACGPFAALIDDADLLPEQADYVRDQAVLDYLVEDGSLERRRLVAGGQFFYRLSPLGHAEQIGASII